MFLSETSTGIPVWLAGDAASPLVKCAAIAATSSGFAVSVHHAGDRGAADGYSSAIDIGRQSEKKLPIAHHCLTSKRCAKPSSRGKSFLIFSRSSTTELAMFTVWNYSHDGQTPPAPLGQTCSCQSSRAESGGPPD